MTLETDPVDLYRALLDGLCLGTRRIVDTLESAGLEVGELVVTGGLAERNPHLVQIIANVCARTVRVPEVEEATARGAAIHGAVAARVVEGFDMGAERLGAQRMATLEPDPVTTAPYDEVYALYRELSDTISTSGLMPALRRLGRGRGSG